jgi:hypothetical protein
MSAPKGNSFWKNRSKHGRDKLFESSDLMWKAACEYFQWCDDHPWYKTEAIKSGDFCGSMIDIPTQRPYTLSGLCLYLHCNSAYFRTFKVQLPEGEQDFNTVIRNIEDVIYTQKFEGAAVGAFNANIIARDLGLADKVNSENTNYNINSVELTKDEMRDISNALNESI